MAARTGGAPDTSQVAALTSMTTAAPSAVLGRDLLPIMALITCGLPNMDLPFHAGTTLPAELPNCNGQPVA